MHYLKLQYVHFSQDTLYNMCCCGEQLSNLGTQTSLLTNQRRSNPVHHMLTQMDSSCVCEAAWALTEHLYLCSHFKSHATVSLLLKSCTLWCSCLLPLILCISSVFMKTVVYFMAFTCTNFTSLYLLNLHIDMQSK